MKNRKNNLNHNECEALIGIMKLRNHLSRSSNQLNYKYKSNVQLRMLEKIYDITKYPSTSTRTNLAILLNIPERSIQIWFQNVRQMDRERQMQSFSTNQSNFISDNLSHYGNNNLMCFNYNYLPPDEYKSLCNRSYNIRHYNISSQELVFILRNLYNI
ncbi:Homeobox protein HD-4 [Astathelohania contejeani]|uniref:Homeobox protein HD-4 n=1 Tax=Astathelohania contejeani TaxID=164912 RepID=A0ABQ7I269_9MICR|nr:Homeobox protein HD-4 [Thelohania contejeani]